MTLREFAEKYSLDANDLFELLVFEQFPIESVDDEIDNHIINYLAEYAGINKQVKKGKGTSNAKGNGRNIKLDFNHKKEYEKREDHISPLIAIPLKEMTISMFSDFSKKSGNDIISFFLKSNKLYSIYKELSVEEVKECASFFNLKTLVVDNTHSVISNSKKEGTFKRDPIVVVVGHVDHGKTTLLDVIRNSSVVAKEKGGITQHIGASKIVLPSGSSLVLIDTPGHEAFCKIRSQGLSVADIVILVVAADDGVMPQTIESIRMIKQAKLNIIVAINKIDKMGSGGIDKIYSQLSEQNILVEQWGGEIPCLHISALKKQGIEELLDVVVLIADILDLKTNLDANAIGYVLDSRFEKGVGPVATIILHQGILRIGDFFYTGTVFGKVVSLVNARKESLQLAYPSDPIVVSGFDSICSVGEVFYKTVTLKESKDLSIINKNREKDLKGSSCLFDPSKKKFNIIFKADTISSLDALIESISKMKGKFYYDPYVLSSSVGLINENDCLLAKSTNSLIYTLHVKETNQVKEIVKEHNVKVKSYDIIYKLFEDIEEQIEKERPINKIEKKIGELLILKLFPLKFKGTVAGFRVMSGSITNNSKIKLIRGKEQIYSGPIDSLQKEKESVKEVLKGHEGALFVNKFSDWKENEKIEVFIEVDDI